ncbi:MAG: hypothetical protein AB1815_12535 [Bacillota bacterium]
MDAFQAMVMLEVVRSITRRLSGAVGGVVSAGGPPSSTVVKWRLPLSPSVFGFFENTGGKEREAECPKSKRAADYYLGHGDYFNVLRYFVKSGDGQGMVVALHGYLNT